MSDDEDFMQESDEEQCVEFPRWRWVTASPT